MEDQTLPLGAGFAWAEESSGRMASGQGQRRHLLEINSLVSDEQLQVVWTYSREVHQRETVAKLAGWMKEALEEVVAHCQETDSATYAPADFPLAQLNQEDLDNLITEINS